MIHFDVFFMVPYVRCALIRHCSLSRSKKLRLLRKNSEKLLPVSPSPMRMFHVYVLLIAASGFLYEYLFIALMMITMLCDDVNLMSFRPHHV